MTEIIETKNVSLKKETRYKKEKCKVLDYNIKSKELDIDFRGYGVRLYDIEITPSDAVIVKYTGTIGEPDFKCKVANV